MGRLWKKLAAFLLAGVLTGCSAPAKEMQQPVERSLFAMNTYMTFTVYGEDAQAALQEAEECIQQVEGLWSVTDENSEIYQANHSGGQPGYGHCGGRGLGLCDPDDPLCGAGHV